MRLAKCDAYTAKETLRNRERKTYAAAAAKREGQEKQPHKQIIKALQ